jgi:hypothetical protein
MGIAQAECNAATPDVERMYTYTSLDGDTGLELQKDVSASRKLRELKLV